MTAFFQGAKNISIKGGSFSVVNGGMQVFDNSRHTTNIDSFNTRNDMMYGSHNNNSQRFHGSGANLLHPNLEHDHQRSASAASGSTRQNALPPPSAHPSQMNGAYAPPGSRTHNEGSFNTTNHQVDDAYNNNSREYGYPSSRGEKRRKKKEPAYFSEDEGNDTRMSEGEEYEDDQTPCHSAKPPSNSPSNGFDERDSHARGARGTHPPPDSWQYGHPYPYPPPPPQQMYPYHQYGYPPPGPYHHYSTYGGGYPQQAAPGIYQMGEHERREFAQVMNLVKQDIAKDVREIQEENKENNTASGQEVVSSDEESDSDSQQEVASTARRFAKSKRVPKAPRHRLSTGMAKMSLDDESRPEFSRVKSDPQRPMPTGVGAEPATGPGPSPPQHPTQPRHSNSDPEIPEHLKGRAFAGFDGPSVPYGTGSGVHPSWPGVGSPAHASPFGPHVSAMGGSYTAYPNGYTHIDNSSHTNNHGSYNYTNNVTQDSFNDNSVKVSGSIEDTTRGSMGYNREKAPRKQGPYQRS